MTDKRFITNDPYGYSRIFINGSRLTNKNVAKKLNELNDENQQLKIQNELLEDELEQCKAVINKKWGEYLKKEDSE